MRTALLLNNFGLGGAERVALHIINHYIELHKPVVLILMENTIKYNIPSNVKVIILGNKNASSGFAKFVLLPLQAYYLVRIARRERLDLILSMTTRPNYVNIVSRLLYRRCYYVISERSMPSQEYRGWKMGSLVNKFLIRNLYKVPRKIICNSNGNRVDLIDNFGIAADRIKVIHNPVDTKLILEVEEVEVFDKSYINFISIGRLDSNKNFQMMIQAFARISRDDLRLYILGAGVEYENLLELIRTMSLQNKVFLVGEVNNPFYYLKSADAFLFTSRSEGFPNVLLEALVSGVFIISHNCKSGADEILFDKMVECEEILENHFGMLTPYEKVDKFAEAIALFISRREALKVRRINDLNEKIQKYEKSLVVKEYIKYLED